MDEMEFYYRAMAFEFAIELSKQLIALATGILTLTVTFSKGLLERVSRRAGLLLSSWIVYCASIMCGIWYFMAVTGILATAETPDLFAGSVRLPIGLQIVTFLVATVLIVIYAIRALVRRGSVPKG